MSVYVDNMEAPFGRMVMCHMWADTYPELLHMVDVIGVDRKWVQHPPKASWVHFDIALSKRALAVKAGAIELTTRQAVPFTKAQRLEPTYAGFYPGFIDGYALGSQGVDYDDLPKYMQQGAFYSGWAYAWEELGLLSPDIPF